MNRGHGYNLINAETEYIDPGVDRKFTRMPIFSTRRNTCFDESLFISGRRFICDYFVSSLTCSSIIPGHGLSCSYWNEEQSQSIELSLLRSKSSSGSYN